MDIHIPEAQKAEKQNEPKETHSEIHYIQTVNSQLQKESFESNKKRKMTHLYKGNPSKIISGFISQNFAGQMGVGKYIQNADRKNRKQKTV